MLAALVVSAAVRAARARGDATGTATWSARWPGRCCVLTLGGSSLLYLLIQRGAATAVTSLLYLVPPCTAVMAWLLFGEAFTPLMMLGMALTVVGVGARGPRQERSRRASARERIVASMFEGFESRRFRHAGVELHARCGGAGPPLLLLHGHPQTHAIWHRVAPALAEHFTRRR